MEVTFIKTPVGTTAVPTQGNESFLAHARTIADFGDVEVTESKTHMLRSLREMKDLAKQADAEFLIVAESRPLSSNALTRAVSDLTNNATPDELLAPRTVVSYR